MLSEWRRFKGWVVLEHFLEDPDSRAYARGLAKETGVSPLSASHYLRLYAKEGLLRSEKLANSIYYKLDSDSPVVKSLKRFYFLAKLGRIEEAPSGTVSIAVFGTHASGEYGQSSDVDVLVVSQGKPPTSMLTDLEARAGKRVDVTVMGLGAWRSLAKKDKGFYKSVMNNHVLLWGAPL